MGPKQWHGNLQLLYLCKMHWPAWLEISHDQARVARMLACWSTKLGDYNNLLE